VIRLNSKEFETPWAYTIVPPEMLGSVFRWNVIPDNGLPPLLHCRRRLTISSSFVTIGSKSPLALRGFGGSGVTH